MNRVRESSAESGRTAASGERRRHRRVRTKIQIVVRRQDIEEVFVESENMSLGGVLLRSENPFDKGTKIIMHFHLPNCSDPVIVKGKIVNLRGEQGVGVEFIDLDPATEEIIRQHLLFGNKG